MGNLIPESLVWLNQIENLKGQTAVERRAELKKDYGLSKSQITNLLTVKACFDQPAIDKVRQAPFILSLNSALALAGLNGKVEAKDLPTAVQDALDVTLARRLATKKIKNLVKWIISGNPASEFDPHKAVKPSPKKTGISSPGGTQPSSILSLDHDKLAELNNKAKAEKARGDGQTQEQEKLDKYIQKFYASHSPSKNSVDSVKGLSLSETMYDDWLADIKVIQQIKNKVRRGKPVTKEEKNLLKLHKAGELAGHAIRFILRMVKVFFKGIHWIFKVLTDVLKEVGLYKYAKALLIYAAFFLAIWFAWEAFRYGVMRPIEFVAEKVFAGHRAESPAVEPPPVRSSELGQAAEEVRSSQLGSSQLTSKTSNFKLRTSNSTPVASYQPAVSFIPSASSTKTLYDPKILELEIAAISANSVINDYVFQPDEGMPVDLAVSRLQDLTDADKYTMMIGGDKLKIESFTPSNTHFIITYKSTDLFGVLGGGPHQINFFWEDVKYIHINEIDHFSSKPGSQPDIKYQCTVVSKSAKDSLTLQCDSADDLENLVSALEYFIRHSRLGRDAQPGGLPYPDQGIQFNNDRVVTLLWSKSPMDKSGVVLGDHLWSAGKITPEQQSKKNLEAGLQTLPITLFTASPVDWEKAQMISRQPGMGNPFKPRLGKIVLQP